jgi:hypothetical protein
MQNVESQNISEIGYDQPKRQLGVIFKFDLNIKYIYENVPPNVWLAFSRSASKGVHHSAHIKNKFSFKKEHVSHTRK